MRRAWWVAAGAGLVVAGCASRRVTYEYERPVTIVTTGDPRTQPPPAASGGAPDATVEPAPAGADAPAAYPPATPQPRAPGTAAAAAPTATPVPAGPPPTAPPPRPTSWRYGEKR